MSLIWMGNLCRYWFTPCQWCTWVWCHLWSWGIERSLWAYNPLCAEVFWGSINIYCQFHYTMGKRRYLKSFCIEGKGPFILIVNTMVAAAGLSTPTWGPSWADMTQIGLMLAPWTLLSGNFLEMFQPKHPLGYCYNNVNSLYLGEWLTL